MRSSLWRIVKIDRHQVWQMSIQIYGLYICIFITYLIMYFNLYSSILFVTMSKAFNNYWATGGELYWIVAWNNLDKTTNALSFFYLTTLLWFKLNEKKYDNILGGLILIKWSDWDRTSGSWIQSGSFFFLKRHVTVFRDHIFDRMRTHVWMMPFLTWLIKRCNAYNYSYYLPKYKT